MNLHRRAFIATRDGASAHTIASKLSGLSGGSTTRSFPPWVTAYLIARISASSRESSGSLSDPLSRRSRTR